MSFEEIVAVLEKAFQLELKIVDDTTAFEVAGEDGDTRVRVVVQNEGERKVVLMSADLGPLPPEGGEKLFITLLEANNLFAQRAGAQRMTNQSTTLKKDRQPWESLTATST